MTIISSSVIKGMESNCWSSAANIVLICGGTSLRMTALASRSSRCIQYERVFCFADDSTHRHLSRLTALHSQLQQKVALTDARVEYAGLFCCLLETVRTSGSEICTSEELRFAYGDSETSSSTFLEAWRRVIDAAICVLVDFKADECKGVLSENLKRSNLVLAKQLIGLLRYVLDTLLPNWEIEDGSWLAEPYSVEMARSLLSMLRAYAHWSFVRLKVESSTGDVGVAELAKHVARLKVATQHLREVSFRDTKTIRFAGQSKYLSNCVHVDWPRASAVDDAGRLPIDTVESRCVNQHKCFVPNQDWTCRVSLELWLYTSLYLARVDNLPAASSALSYHAVLNGRRCACAHTVASLLTSTLVPPVSLDAEAVLRLVPVNDSVSSEHMKGDAVATGKFVLCT